MKIEDRYYKQVQESSSSIKEYLVPEGITVKFIQFGGDAAYSNLVKVEIVFGDIILFSTHSSTVQDSIYEVVGDGEKSIKINLVNDTEVAETIGGYWIGIVDENTF